MVQNAIRPRIRSEYIGLRWLAVKVYMAVCVHVSPDRWQFTLPQQLLSAESENPGARNRQDFKIPGNLSWIIYFGAKCHFYTISIVAVPCITAQKATARRLICFTFRIKLHHRMNASLYTQRHTQRLCFWFFFGSARRSQKYRVSVLHTQIQ